SYYRDSAEPIATDVAGGYDPLADLIRKAHAHGLKVHGWVVSFPVWRDGYNQPDRRHVWYTHGPTAPGAENWFMLRDDGRTGDCGGPNDCTYFLDPGHPAAADYTLNVLLRLVTRYDLDGLHLDYIRYPSNRFGYNPVSLQRFQQATGRSGRPAPDDGQWTQWRRDQVTKLVKRIYLNMLAHKPAMQLSVAAIAWGAAPPNGDFKASSPYVRTLQDWAGWLEAGYIDWALPMVYSRASDAQQGAWYNGWVDWTKAHQGRRAAGIGVGAWLNDPEGNMAQLRHATNDRTLLGASLYAYATPVVGDRGAFFDRLRNELWSDDVPAPTLPWKAEPQTGYLLGRIAAGGAAVPDAQLRLVGPGGVQRAITSDGSGVFGDVELQPGAWTVTARDPRTNAEINQAFDVAAGRVTHVAFEAVAPRAEEPLAPAPADRAFGELWNRTDLAVARAQTGRSWMWGPQSFATGSEAYREAPGGRRTVQYWDKSRMEVNNPGADRGQLWFVTNGLLARELISGKMQVGESEFVQRQPSGTPVAGDPDPQSQRYSYAMFARVASLDGDRRAPAQVGARVVQTMDEQGNVGSDEAFARHNVVNAEYNNELGHNIPNVFKAYLDTLPLPWVFVMGYPITEAYWTRATLRGQPTDILVQMYERRTLTYTPSNPAAFRVEMGNVGQHYYRWRYGSAPWER
ncbi:MAG: family 10 glycosylhydrolase, partial [Chloroflexota bacterium]|nr:family 10 glycosylhydrolase [Chloroflexota bacterium]